MKIRTQFILAVVASVLIPVIAVALLAIEEVRENALHSFERSIKSEIAQVDKGISLYLNGLAEDVAFLAQTSVIKNLDASVSKYMAASRQMKVEEFSETEKAAFELMRQFGEARDDLAYVYLGLSDGGYIQWPLGPSSDNYDPRKRPWYTNSINKSEAVRVPAYADVTTGTPLLDYLQRFEAKDGLIGSVGVDVTLGKLTEIVSDIRFLESGYVMLVEDTGNVLADPQFPKHNFTQLKSLGEGYQKLASMNAGVHSLQIEGQSWLANVYLSPQLGWKFIAFVPEQEVYGTANKLSLEILGLSLVAVIVFGMLGAWLSNLIIRPMSAITGGLQNIATGEGDLTCKLEVSSKGEAGTMASAFNAFVESILNLVKEIKSNSAELKEVSEQAQSVSHQVKQTSETQSESIQQVSHAFEEIVMASNAVASNCTEAAMQAEEGTKQVQRGHGYINSVVSSVGNLETSIHDSNSAMSELAEESSNITSILDTIRGIAEQTNLLALNAAIEAARAGDQGRGFAVVADEVRTLAQKTAESTEEIDRLLSGLQNKTGIVSSRLAESLEQSTKTVEATEQTKAVFESIQSSVSSIRDMMTQIAAATEEQNLVAEDVKRSVQDVLGGAQQAHSASEEVQQNSARLGELATHLDHLVGRFTTH